MKPKSRTNTNPENELVVRLDKWLWAARFYKTRALARKAIEGGKVEIEGVRAKPSKNIKIGVKIKLRLGYDIREFKTMALADKRGSASQASRLYQESEQSILAREKAAQQRKISAQSIVYDDRKPKKHQRRLMQKLKRNQ